MELGNESMLPSIVNEILNKKFDVVVHCNNWFEGAMTGTHVKSSGLDESGNAMSVDYIEEESKNRGLDWSNLKNKKVLFIDIWEMYMGWNGPNQNSTEKISELIDKYSLNPSDFYFSNLDTNLGKNFKSWLKMKSNEKWKSTEWTIRPPSYNVNLNANNFFGVFYNLIMGHKYFKDQYEKQRVSIFNSNPNKLYISLNGTQRWHREILYKFLKNENLLDKGYMSYLGKGIAPFDDETHPRGDDPWGPVHLKQYFDESYFTILTENAMGKGAGNYNLLVLTEKTMRNLVWGHPFILFGNKGSLKYLNSIGFQTYSDIFDESYDEIESADERCKFILDEIKRVCSLSKRDLTKKFKNVHDISLHNQKLFLDESFIERYFSEIIDKL